MRERERAKGDDRSPERTEPRTATSGEQAREKRERGEEKYKGAKEREEGARKRRHEAKERSEGSP